MNRLLKSFRYAWQGIRYNFKTQANFRIHTLGFIFMNFATYFFQFSLLEYIICFVLSSLVFFAELMNTAIESVVDLTTKEQHELAKIAKDCAAGAVLILSVCAVIVFGLILMTKFKIPFS
jgi:diacylglycerol kinase (ATP)